MLFSPRRWYLRRKLQRKRLVHLYVGDIYGVEEMRTWAELESNLKRLLDELKKQPSFQRSELADIPDKGIYVFYYRNKAIYVGRSNRLKARILEHGRPSSKHNSAPFAFNIAKGRMNRGLLDSKRTRKELEVDAVFITEFTRAKQRVALMKVQVLEVEDPVMQTIFEVYAALQLKTLKYNRFDTH